MCAVPGETAPATLHARSLKLAVLFCVSCYWMVLSVFLFSFASVFSCFLLRQLLLDGVKCFLVFFCVSVFLFSFASAVIGWCQVFSCFLFRVFFRAANYLFFFGLLMDGVNCLLFSFTDCQLFSFLFFGLLMDGVNCFLFSFTGCHCFLFSFWGC